MPSDNYPFSVGRIKLIENSLLDRSRIARLRELNFYEALKQLCDWGYAADYPIKTDPDALIDFRRAEVRSLILDVTPNAALTDLFYLDMDATNLKLLLKSRLLGGEDIKDDAMSAGTIDISVLRECVNTRNYDVLPTTLCTELGALEQTLKHHVEPRILSAYVDNAFFKLIQAVLKKNKNEFCNRYFKTKTDYTNVLSVLRARELKWDETDFMPMIVCGGEITNEQLLNAVSCEDEKLGSILAGGENSTNLRRALEFYKNGSFEEARDLISESQLASACNERYDSFGIGPIAYFLLASENECRTLRVLFAKKRADKTK